MTKKAVIVGNGELAKALVAAAKVLTDLPQVNVVFVDTDVKDVELNREDMTIAIDSKMIDGLKASLTPDDINNIVLHEMHHKLLMDQQLSEYRIGRRHSYIHRDEPKEVVLTRDDLPKNAKKPKFLLEQNHNIRGFRR